MFPVYFASFTKKTWHSGKLPYLVCVFQRKPAKPPCRLAHWAPPPPPRGKGKYVYLGYVLHKTLQILSTIYSFRGVNSFLNLGVSSSLMPCPFTGPKMFCAGPNFLSQSKNLTAFSASSKTVVRAQRTILLNANHLFVLQKMFGQAKTFWDL